MMPRGATAAPREAGAKLPLLLSKAMCIWAKDLMMSGFSTRTRSLGLGVLMMALLTACGASTSATTSPAATSAASATSPATSTAIPTDMPTAEPTTQPSPTSEPTTSATMTAMDHTQHSASGAEMELDIKLFMFKPSPLEIKAGTTLIWTNQDAIDHSVTAGKPGSLSGAFDSDFFEQGQTFEFTFDEPGTYDYFCKRHESMGGTIVVTAP
jgi:plastocyanin